MLRVYDYIFYRFYLLFANQSVPIFTAILAVSQHFLFNLISIPILLYIFFRIEIVNWKFIADNISKLYLVLLLLLFLGINLYYFLGKKRYIDIFKRYKRETKDQKAKGRKIIITYIVVTWMIALFSAIIMGYIVRAGG